MAEHLIKEPKLSSASNTGPVRPKVMKRPAQFSTLGNSAEILPITEEIRLDLVPPTPAPLRDPVRRAWQEDARFGVALFIAIIVINCLAAWNFSAQPAVSTTPPPEITPSNALPAPHRPTHPVINVLDDQSPSTAE